MAGLTTVPENLRVDGEFFAELIKQLETRIPGYRRSHRDRLCIFVNRWIDYYLDGRYKPRNKRPSDPASIPHIVHSVFTAMLAEYDETLIPSDILERVTRPNGRRAKK